MSHVQERHTNGQEVHDDVATESSVHVSGDDLLACSQPTHSPPPHTYTHHPGSIPSSLQLIPPLLLLQIPMYRLTPIFVDGSSPVLYF